MTVTTATRPRITQPGPSARRPPPGPAQGDRPAAARDRLTPPVLVLGYGNPGRLDDGLGPAFCDALARLAPAGVEVRSAMQLAVEDAARAARFATVIFVDASLPDGQPFTFEPVTDGSGRVAFSSHTSSPGDVVALARTLFDAPVRGWTLAIRGARFQGFGEELSPTARDHLQEALAHLLHRLPDRVPDAPGREA